MMQPLLRYGSVGPYVAWLQQALNLGDSDQPELDEDGIFGSLTQNRVKEFQGDNSLSQDGVVGPNTYDAMSDLINQLMQMVPTPEDENTARDRIVAVAQSAVATMGWANSAPSPPDGSGRIAAKYGLGDNVDGQGTQTRQGGFSLATVHQIAGADGSRCQTISADASAMYQQYYPDDPPATVRNSTDLPSWCGICALYIWKVAGLKKMPAWIQKPFNPFGTSITPVKFLSRIDRGDIGIVSPSGRNHHFVVTSVNGIVVKSVDGNAGFYQSIVAGGYEIIGTKIDDKGCFRTNTAQGNEPVMFISPNWKTML
jgi:peptidoglycan hydrolase-like protein with peptidoglycan-binding domain